MLEHSIGIEFLLETFVPPFAIGADVEFPLASSVRVDPPLQFDFLRHADNPS